MKKENVVLLFVCLMYVSIFVLLLAIGLSVNDLQIHCGYLGEVSKSFKDNRSGGGNGGVTLMQDEMPPAEVPPTEGAHGDYSNDCINCDNPPELIVYGCTNPKAINFLGDWEGFTMIDDGSCTCMDIILDVWGNVLSADEVDCGKANNSFNEWMAWDYNQNLAPDETAYFSLIDLYGCTDKEALNYLDPVWWEGYNIVEDGSCVFEEIVFPLYDALEWN